MRIHSTYSAMLAPFILLASAPLSVMAGDVLKTNGYSSCQTLADIKVNALDIEFDRSTKKIKFDVSGTSEKEQKVTATLIVMAYGKEVYKKEFNPCDDGTKVEKLCPVPVGTFAAKGEQTIPDQFISQIPSIAFSVPDLDSQATMQLKAIDGGQQLACITSFVNNGKTLAVPGVSYVAAGMAVGALAVSGLSALASAGQAGSPTASPTFIDVMTWFQSMAMTGMMSADIPNVYMSWSKNFAFSCGLVTWDGLQTSIDNFREKTGGNLTEQSIAFLRNATLITAKPDVTKRALDSAVLWARDGLNTNLNASGETKEPPKNMFTVEGIERFAAEAKIPSSNTFMTILLIFAIVVASITVAILLFKVILETWALCGKFPKRLTNFRKRYWWTLAKTLTNLVFLLYSIWVLWSLYQFKRGDAWAPKVLAGVTLGIFTAVLAFFTWKIWSVANKYKKMEGDTSALYDNKELWRKYSIFYENYKKSYWWLFVPIIIYMLAKGCVMAGADGHPLAQAAGSLIIEALLLIVLLWVRPFSLNSGNWINIIIQVVRVLSVVCVLVFVPTLGMAQTTKTVTGLVLVVIQAVLTALLAILIAVNAIIVCCRDNPHRKKRKEAEKARDLDNLTPLDARNSLLMDPQEYKRSSIPAPFGSRPAGYESVPLSEQHTAYAGAGGPPATRQFQDRQILLSETASLGHVASHTRSMSGERSQSPPGRNPTLPNVGFSPAATGGGYTDYVQAGHNQPPAYRGQGHAY